MSTHPIRFDRLQAGIVAWLQAAHPSARVLWHPSEWPRAQAGLDLALTAKIIAGPDSTPLGGESSAAATLPLTAVARVLPAAAGAVGEDVVLFASGRRFEYAIAAGDATVENVRDGWLESLGVGGDPGPMVSASFVAQDTDEILITATTLGDLHGLAVLGSIAGLVELEVLTTAVAQVQVEDVQAVIRIEAWATSRYPRGGALAALANLLGRRTLSASTTVLDAHGLSLDPGRVISLDGMTGPQWDSRATVDLDVGMLSIAAEAPLVIERVRGTLIARGDPEILVALDTESDS